MERASSMKSWPAMKGDSDFEKSMTDSVWLTMNKSRLVCDGGSRWRRWWVGRVETTERARFMTRLQRILVLGLAGFSRSAIFEVACNNDVLIVSCEVR